MVAMKDIERLIHERNIGRTDAYRDRVCDPVHGRIEGVDFSPLRICPSADDITPCRCPPHDHAGGGAYHYRIDRLESRAIENPDDVPVARVESDVRNEDFSAHGGDPPRE